MPRPHPLALALLAATPLLGACASTDPCAVPSPYLGVATERATDGESVTGSVEDASGRAVAAKVWTVRDGGGTSVDGRGAFDLPTLGDEPFALTVQTESGHFATLVDCVPNPEPLRVVATEPGAWLEITNASDSDERVVVRHRGVTVLAFTVRAGETTRQLVPAGPVEVSMPKLDDAGRWLDLEPTGATSVVFGASE